MTGRRRIAGCLFMLLVLLPCGGASSDPQPEGVAVEVAKPGVDAAALPTADEILEKASAVMDGLKSFEADLRTEQTGYDGEGTSLGRLVIERSQQDGKTVERVCFGQKSTTKPHGDDPERVVEYKTVNDGVHSWVETHEVGSKQILVTKTDSEGADVTKTWRGEEITHYVTYTYQQIGGRVFRHEFTFSRGGHAANTLSMATGVGDAKYMATGPVIARPHGAVLASGPEAGRMARV